MKGPKSCRYESLANTADSIGEHIKISLPPPIPVITERLPSPPANPEDSMSAEAGKENELYTCTPDFCAQV